MFSCTSRSHQESDSSLVVDCLMIRMQGSSNEIVYQSDLNNPVDDALKQSPSCFFNTYIKIQAHCKSYSLGEKEYSGIAVRY